jgi:hypothetical protein
VVDRSDRERLDLEYGPTAEHVLATSAPLDDVRARSAWRRARSRALVAACGVALWLAGASLDVASPRPAITLQPTAARASDAPRRPGLSSETLDADISDKPSSSKADRAERAKARKEAWAAKREAARQARAEKAQARKEAAEERHAAAKAKHEEAHAKYVAAMQARKEAAEEKKAAAKSQHEEAHAKYVAAMQARKEAAEEKKEAAKAKREEAHAKYVAAMQARKEAAEARREAKHHKSEDSSPVQDAAPASSSAFDSEAVASASAPAMGGGGTLRLNSLPWAEVYIDGRKVGNTPQRALSVSPGEHDVRLVNNAFDMVASFHVRVNKGQSITKGVMLEER